jgi:hypothetical protein
MQMTELQCGEFVLVRTDVNTGHPRWRAELTPNPITREWQDALSDEAAEASRRGVYLGEGGIEIHYTGGFMFHAPAGTEAAIANAMREIVEKTNVRMAELRARNVEYGRARAATAGFDDSVTTMSPWADHLATNPPAVLYHYTTQRGLLGIATSKSLWATSVHRLADSTEFSGASDLGRVQITQSLHYDAELAQHLRQALDSIARVHIYVCCFSEEGDLLSQWRAYCRDGGGVSLGFDPMELRSIGASQGFTLVKCIYDAGRAIALINGLIQDAVAARRADIPLDKRYREGDTLITPFFDLSLVSGGGRMRLVETYAGPSRHPGVVTTTALTNFLISQQVDCRGVRPTHTPFRL